MNPDDYAIIIGLKEYPGLGNLGGPENDARAFRDWVILPTGGGLTNDPQHVQLILSSGYQPSSSAIWDGLPDASKVQIAFQKLRAIHEQKVALRKGPRIGRRLYIYMAGHGISPTTTGGKNEHEAALLMANVDPAAYGPSFQLPGAYAATWFSLNDCFAEIFLFMDCCRGAEWVPASNEFMPVRGTKDSAQRCYIFSTRWAQAAREKLIVDANNVPWVRGIFTQKLLLGLSGQAAVANPNTPGQGVITVSSLKSYLYRSIRKSQTNSTTALTVEIQEPDVDYWPKEDDGKNIIIKDNVPVPTFPVLIQSSAGQTGQVRIYREYNDKVSRIKANPQFAADWPIDLPPGLYLATFTDALGNDSDTDFAVEGTEDKQGVVVTRVILN